MANSKNKPSTDLSAVVFDRLFRYVEPGQRLCIALSGGIDSVALLHVVATSSAKLNVQPLVACHVHHGLSPHADEWEAFCRRLCTDLDIALKVRRVVVNPNGEGVEAAARKARYAELDAHDGNWILLGHHRDDQAETVLLNLLRGAGVHGTAGMAERRGRLLRPLLDVSRKEIVDYAKQIGLSWIEDESNADDRYSRNFLRHRVMPVLEQPFPQAVMSLARAAHAFGEAAELLDQMAADDLGAKLLNVSRLRELPAPRAANLLAYYLRHHGLQIPGSAMLKEMLRQLTTADGDSIVSTLRSETMKSGAFHDDVFVEATPEPVMPVAWSGENTVPWSGYRLDIHSVIGDGIDALLLAHGRLQFFPAPRRRCHATTTGGPRRPLKDLLREAGVPHWRRKSLPVLYSDDEVVWVAGIGIAAKYRCKPGTAGFLIEFDGVTW